MARIHPLPFAELPDMGRVQAWKIEDGEQSLLISELGATIVEWFAPNQQGERHNIVLGLPEPLDYAVDEMYLGTTVGRFANRIAKGQFTLNRQEYRLPLNNFPNQLGCCLHGGEQGFNRKHWQCRGEIDGNDAVLHCHMNSPDGDQGFPGHLTLKLVYRFNQFDGLRLEFNAQCDQDTYINLTNHSYFNLAGHGDVLSHTVRINADRYLPIDQHLIPTGEQALVTNSPFDFKSPVVIGERIEQPHPQLQLAQGFDHCFCLNDYPQTEDSLLDHGLIVKNGTLKPFSQLTTAAEVTDPNSGRRLRVATSEPGIQFYTGNFLATKAGRSQPLHPRAGLCLETQHFPDSPNQPHFPSTLLKAKQPFQSRSVFQLDCLSKDSTNN